MYKGEENKEEGGEKCSKEEGDEVEDVRQRGVDGKAGDGDNLEGKKDEGCHYESWQSIHSAVQKMWPLLDIQHTH